MKRPAKANNRVINQDFLNNRIAYSKKLGYGKQKWVEFCEVMLGNSYEVKLYEARKSVSKYITVTCLKTKNSFKVRFSNHKPIKFKEKNGDCDFFVGRTNLGISTTDQAIEATLNFFKERIQE